MRFIARVFLVLLFLFSVVGFTQLAATSASAQDKYALPDTEANVPIDQHTIVQSLFIETLSAISCQLAGIDSVRPSTPCLGINPETNKLGYVDSLHMVNGKPQLGGLMGVTASGIGMMYTPTITSSEYIRYMAGNFGIAKNTYAAPTTGFEGLSPIMNLWKISRDISYYLLIIVFIFIGLGIMLRLRIDPRTVMNIQNQIPRVIICIIMITFSYPLMGLYIDGMWGLTYLGINMVTEGANTAVPDCKTGKNVRQLATNAVLQTPISFGNQVFMQECDTGVPDIGLFDISGDIANSISSLQVDLVLSFLGIDADKECSSGLFSNLISHPIDCITVGLAHTLWKVLFSAVWFIIIVAAILFSLFRIWFALLMAFAKILLYGASAPLWFVMGLLPKRPMGIEKWTRAVGANVLVFPATATLLVVARQFQDQWTHGTKAAEAPGILQQVHAQSTTTVQYFVPPLVGNPNADHFGSIVAFAIILITPTMISLLQEKLGSSPLKQAAAVGAGIAAGAAVPGMASKKAWSGLTRHNPQTGAPEAPISRIIHSGKKKLITAFTDNGKFSKTPFKGMATKTLERMKNKGAGRGAITDKEARQYGYNVIPGKETATNTTQQSAQKPQGQRSQGRGAEGRAAEGNYGQPSRSQTYRERHRAAQGAQQTQKAQQPQAQGAAKTGQEVKITSLSAERLSVGHIDLPENKGSMQVPFDGNNQRAGDYLQTIMGDKTPRLPDISWHSKAMHELSREEQNELLEMIRGHLNP